MCIRDSVREILKDEDLVDDIRHKSWWRGTTIGGIDALGIGISGKVYKSVKGVGKTAEVARVTATAGTEGIVGGIGEFAGQKAAGQETSVLDIGFETTAGMGGTPVSIGTAMLGKGPKYIVLDKDGNETRVSRADMKKFLETQSELSLIHISEPTRPLYIS